MKTLANRLEDAVRAVCPHIHGVSIGDPGDARTWRIDFTDAASESEVSAAFAVVAGFDAQDLSATLRAHAERRRWEKEVGGCLFGAYPVHTDRDSQGKIVAERLAVEAGERAELDYWKFADGQFRALTNVEFADLSDTVRAHIRGCFAIEAAVMAAIEAGTITTTGQIDAAFAA